MSFWPAIIVVGATLLVAYANGANDNFKGVATLFGSGTATYRTAALAAPFKPKDAELFSIVKHGLKFTGMPAWPTQSRDDEVRRVILVHP
mgnify:CR=1 FL=1